MLHHQIFREPDPGMPRILAAFSYRYDAHLVPDLLENIRAATHGFVAWDDRSAGATLSDEPTRRSRLVMAARELGADWLLAPDPDERFEQGFAQWLPDLLAEGDRTLWLFTLREMFKPTEYRIDGAWGAKSVLRLFPVAAAGVDPAAALHGRWVADQEGYRQRDSRINLYHLRMASPARRQLRRDLYAASDPGRRFQPIGYDYLNDERGMVLEPLPPRRGFLPPFAEDHGLWAPDPGVLGPTVPDPYETRLTRAAASARRRGALAAHHVMLDLFCDSPQDHDLLLLAARFALDAGAFDTACALADTRLRAGPDDLYARFVRISAQLAMGLAVHDDLSALAVRLPGSPLVASLLHEAVRPSADFAADDAPWRQQAPADATLHEGAQIARSDLATVVIGFRNQPGLLNAVQSLLDQDAATEIVVVNTGGGAVRRSLAAVAHRIRLITCETPLQVGAARNIGLAASRAPYIAFLAGDCLALPGWVSGRLARHRAGALSVSTAVCGVDGESLVALAANRLRYASRNPDADPRTVSHYGQSYARRLLAQTGHFPPGLPMAEDTVLNNVASRITAPVWEPAVITAHRDLTDLAALTRDERRRGQRRAGHLPFRALADTADPLAAVAPVLRRRLSDASRLVARELGLSTVERRAVLAIQWFAAQADQGGILDGLLRLSRADKLGAQARALLQDPQRALVLARDAYEMDREDPAKACLVGSLSQVTGDLSAARAVYAAALAVAPSHADAAIGLVALVRGQDGPEAALALAEAQAIAAPTARRLWENAAKLALLAGQADRAVMLGQIALGCAVASPGAHARMARIHAAAGNPLGQAFRLHAAARLKAAAARENDPETD
jgi:hypothetical protein